MNYRRILTIQDISCLGQCSMTVALPILSACGQETCILPSAVLSTHTGGFSMPHIRDLSDDLPGVRNHWQKEGIVFDAIYTGYLGSARQVADVMDIFDTLLAPGGRIVVDPAMADHGKLYKGFDDAYVDAIRELCRRADVIMPNMTEACLLTGSEYREAYDEAFVAHVLEKLHGLGIPCVILTGVSYAADETGVLISTAEGQYYYRHKKLARSYHGTGDIYASAFVGAWIGGKTMKEAASIAADFVCRCIENTIGDESHWYGTRFETAIPYLISRLYA